MAFLRRMTSAVLVALLLLAALPIADAISAGKVATATLPNQNTDECKDEKRRGKVLEEPFDEHDLRNAYEEIKSEYHQKAFQDEVSDDWKLLTTMKPDKKCEDDEIIRVSMLEHPSDPLCPYVKMECVMPLSLEDCWNFLSLDKWDETMPKMDPFYEGLDIYGEYSIPMNASQSDSTTSISNAELAVKMILARKRTKRILAFGKREFVFVSVEDIPLKDGTWVSGTVSVEVPESGANEETTTTTAANGLLSLRRNKHYTRAFQDSIAFYKPLSENRTRLTIVCRIDLNDSSGGSGGCIPMWLYVKTIGITGAKSVMSMRKCLLEGQAKQ